MPQYLADKYPRDNGAETWGDSARLAGLMALVDHPDTPPLEEYVIYYNGEWLGVRVPVEDPTSPGANNPYNFTRDQTLPLMAGLRKQEKIEAARKLYESFKKRNFRGQNVEVWDWGSKKTGLFTGPDIFSPSARLAITMAAGVKPSLLLKVFGVLFLILDICWASLNSDDFEINQTIAAAYLIGKLHWIKRIKGWQAKTRSYWCGWRDEPELAEMIINLIQKA